MQRRQLFLLLNLMKRELKVRPPHVYRPVVEVQESHEERIERLFMRTAVRRGSRGFLGLALQRDRF